MEITRGVLITLAGCIGSVGSICGLAFSVRNFPKKRRELLEQIENE